MGNIMKSLMAFVLLLVAIIAVFAKPNNDREFILKFGFQPLSTLSLLSEKAQGTNASQDTKLGISAGLEYFQYLNNVVALGLGAIYDFPRDTNNTNENVSFMPLFVALKLRTPLHGLDNTFMFCSGRLGGSIPMLTNLLDGATQKIGLYYGAGLGFSINFLVIEAIYAINNFSISLPNNSETIDANCQTITLYAGFKFE
ncbi:MAG: hypothetical protein LBD57_00685 [Endomicrobium sp.]|jgi:hypothetical protein|uniref:hypothetical protein n=1 Tax=Candidatus Endomicrobiellum cubanum TaxID=3242325 RepID=UPI00282DC223|nr:hypothetical protein [Endomicrobium sp.]